MKIHKLNDGIIIHGEFGDPIVDMIVRNYGPYPLVIADPPYGNIVPHDWDVIGKDDERFALWMVSWCERLIPVCHEGAALYVWGGIGRPGFRPFYRFIPMCEDSTDWRLANHITWKKKRAYGVQHNYLFTREELAYFTLGDIKKPRMFEVPLLDAKRGYAGYNKKYPAKSDYYRRTSVWSDVTEIMRGKMHPCQKPDRLMEIPITVHTREGETVLDPFAGSGTTGVAARKLGRRFVLIDNDEKSIEMCLKRLGKGDDDE